MSDTQQINVDEQELAKFTNENVRWWDTNGPMQFLHTFNPLRLEFILSHSQLKAKHVLDVGCGGGIFSEAMAKQHCFLTAIDMNTSALQVAREHATSQGLQINYEQSTIESFADRSVEQFDVVTCMEMLEHVPDPGAIVQACANATKPGGWLFFSTINRTLKSFLGAIVAAEYILQMLPKGTHEYRKFLRPSELHQFAKSADLQQRRLQGISMQPLTKQLQLSSKVDINYIVCYQKPLSHETT